MPPADTPADEVARLYSLAPQDFVAERNATVKAWKRDGRKDDAAALAGLRRPSVVESALNRTASRDPATTRAWADAARRADAAQSATIGGADAAELRRAMADLRFATGEMVDAAVRTIDDETKRDDIAGLLRTLSAGGVDQVVAGILGSAVIPAEDLFAGAPTPPRRTRPAKRPARPPSRSSGPARAATPEPAPAPSARRPSARVRALEAEVGRRQGALDALEPKIASARDAVDDARRRLEMLEAKRADAAAALATAEGELHAERDSEA